MSTTGNKNEEIERPRAHQNSKNKHHSHTGEPTGPSRENHDASSDHPSSPTIELSKENSQEPRTSRRSSGSKFHAQYRHSLESATSLQPHHPMLVDDESYTITSNTSDQPGAFREGADTQDTETYTINLNDEIEIEPDPVITDQEQDPLEAEVVEEHDLQKEVQKRMKERTVDATSVKIAGKTGSTSADKRSKYANMVLLVVGLLLLGSGIAIALGTILPSKNSDTESTMSTTPATIVTDEPTSPPTFIISDFDLAKDMVATISGYEALLDVSSPQYKALWWLIHEDPTKLFQSNGMIQSTFLERYVMALFYFTTDGPNSWVEQLGFLGNMSICDWPVGGSDGINKNGVKCNDDGLIVGIKFDENDLNGTLPSELSTLSSLEFISIVGSGLHGTLPPSLGGLHRLQKIELAESQLTGPIPESFSDLRKLEVLWLNFNELTGPIPSGLTEIVPLEILAIEYNFITGTIPELSSMGNLQEFWMGLNMMSGSIPESIYSPNLHQLSLFGNQFTGTLSDTYLGNLEELWTFDVELNNLTGTIPTSIGLLGNVNFLFLSSNSFTGTIPSELGLLTDLTGHLWMHMNQLSGTVPVELSALSPTSLILFANNLTGSLDMFCNKTNLFVQIAADCVGPDPEVICPCCTYCCSSTVFEECTVNLPAICQSEKLQFEDPTGPYYYESAGTICECISTADEKNVTLSCTDTQCQSCNRDGTLCSENRDFSMVYGSNGLWERVENTFQYVVGRNDTVTMVTSHTMYDYGAPMEVAVNGQMCNSVDYTQCADGFMGYDVNCENVDGAGSVNMCDDKHQDDNGPLAVFSLQDPAFLSGCPPRFFDY